MVNVFSFCLYGARNPRYYLPLLQNIQIVAQYFPQWKLYIWIAPDVDSDYVTVLQSYSNVVLRPTGVGGAINMIHRFFAIDEPDVDVMMVRDADSLIHWKDRWAIHRFLETDRVAHVIRDNRYHAAFMMGGLWGLRKSAGLVVADEYALYKKNPRDLGVAHDQNFLSAQLYPKVKDRLWVHYSDGPLVHTNNGREFAYTERRILEGEVGEQFPFQWSDDLYCGRVDGPLPLPSSKIPMSIPRVWM